ncbi:glycosyltransferase [Halobacillus litoralis]|uniref:Glycosyltransferase n=1 Tax=Halobacillus litoralis TaxID=45668 RepID=A0A845DUB5_9BACI|nr:glycosyltransferase family 4 protein [Halobacillus litoralis]MYL20105.1 glycosyltransferase [Halobacillus litoralis]
MRILYVTTISNTIKAFLIPHIKLLISKGHTVDIACYIKKGLDDEPTLKHCNIYEIPFSRSPISRGNLKAYKYLKKIIENNKYDLVHTHTPVASLITRLICRGLPEIKVLYTAHGFHFFKGSPIRNWMIYYPIEKLASRWTDAIITMNEEDYLRAKKMTSRLNVNIYKTSGVGVNLREYAAPGEKYKRELRVKYKLNEEDFILFYAAELNKNKNQNFLIDTIYALKDRVPNIKILLAGDGPMQEKYQEKAKRLGLKQNILFLGRRNDIPDLLKLADVSVASSLREGLPVNIMEAMSTGLPLVVTDRRGHTDLVKENENGYVVSVNNKKEFSEAIYKLYTNVNLRKRFGGNSYKMVLNYSDENVIEELRNIYKYYLE